MIVKTIHEITNMMHATLHGDIDDTKKIHGVVIDSRQVTKDVLYVPIIGQRVDGHTFAKQTIEDGTLISLWQKDHVPYPDFPVILVDDTLQAMQDLSKAYLDELHPLVIGVTGSNGKTSCKDMLYSIFSQEKKTQKTQGNRNSEIGLPLTIFDFDEDIEVAILEMGMENKGEITQLTSIAQPDISVITSIGSAHMENLGGKLQIAQAKCEILEGTKENGLFLYNYESKEIQEVLCTLDTENKNVVSFGQGGDVSITSDIEYDKEGIVFKCNILDAPVHLRAFGDFQAMNALPCIYIAKACHLKEESILNGLKNLEMTKMRTQLISVKNAYILDDTYKSNPESAKAAIDTLMELPANKHIAILSDMLDLGSEEKQLHYDVGVYAKEKGVDELYCTGPLSKETADGFNGKWYGTKDEIYEACKPLLDKDCIIMIKGSRAMKMDTLVDAFRGKNNE